MASSASSVQPAQSGSKAPASPPVVNVEHESRLMAWFERNKGKVSYGFLAVAVVAVGVWLFTETGRRKALAASDALDRARAAYESGNLATASAEFQRVTQNFRGTDAGYQAELALNEVRITSGQAQIAADELQKFVASSPPAYFASGALSLRGTALENVKKYDDAAQAYNQAAQAATEDYRKVDALLGAARATRLAGKEPAAVDILRGILSKYPKTVPGVAEAEVRVAEWTKGAM